MVYMETTFDPTVDEYGDPLECVEDHNGICQGPVEYRYAPSGASIPRCERHQAERWDRYESSDLERYADSDVAPEWFDPSIAGERWDDDY